MVTDLHGSNRLIESNINVIFIGVTYMGETMDNTDFILSDTYNTW